ncbi:hypothetical protein FS317_47040 [Microvirga sp. M8]|nr:hypothetical protein [Microvirga tunisiensis]
MAGISLNNQILRCFKCLSYTRQPSSTFPCIRTASCLVAERCWDRVRYAIEEYTWRFDGLRRRASHRRRT